MDGIEHSGHSDHSLCNHSHCPTYRRFSRDLFHDAPYGKEGIRSVEWFNGMSTALPWFTKDETVSDIFLFIHFYADPAYGKDTDCVMVEWMSKGEDATAPAPHDVDCRMRFGGPIVKVIDLQDGCERDPMARKTIVNQVRDSLSRGQAVCVCPWDADKGKEWQWDDDDFARLSGGTIANGKISLNRKAQWQCEY